MSFYRASLGEPRIIIPTTPFSFFSFFLFPFHQFYQHCFHFSDQHLNHYAKMALEHLVSRSIHHFISSTCPFFCFIEKFLISSQVSMVDRFNTPSSPSSAANQVRNVYTKPFLAAASMLLGIFIYLFPYFFLFSCLNFLSTISNIYLTLTPLDLIRPISFSNSCRDCGRSSSRRRKSSSWTCSN